MRTLPLCPRCGNQPVSYRLRTACYECVPKAPAAQACGRCGNNRVAYPGRGTCYSCVPRTLEPRLCERCRVNPIAYHGRTTCFGCVPRVRPTLARCKKCGSSEDYFTNGRCRRCHRKAPVIDACHDCLAWGVTRRRDWRCQGCTAWRRRFPTAQQCRCCQRLLPLNRDGHCRLCVRQAGAAAGGRHRRVDVIAANRDGQQLFLADLFRQKRPEPAADARPARRPARYPVTHRQLALFDTEPDFTAGRRRGFPEPALPRLADYLDEVLLAHGTALGWAKGTIGGTRSAIRILLGTQQTPGALITTTEIIRLRAIELGSTRTVSEVLEIAGMWHNDQEPTINAWFRAQQDGIAEPMADELRQWFEMLRDGSTTAPRSRPRPRNTITALVSGVIPLLRTWSLAGHQSLRGIDRDLVLDTMPTVAFQRHRALTSLRSLFRYLKARRVIFANPTARIRGIPVRLGEVLPIDLRPVRDAIDSDNPARAALAALIAFHALLPMHVVAIQLHEVRDGRLHLPDRTIPLARTVREKLTAWLDYRQRRWPNTVNPHLFINHRNAIRITACGTSWVSATIGVSAQALRMDRILHEAVNTQGDVRRLTDMFGVSVMTAERYAFNTIEPTGPGVPAAPPLTHVQRRDATSTGCGADR